jgi:hypothetical protein
MLSVQHFLHTARVKGAKAESQLSQPRFELLQRLQELEGESDMSRGDCQPAKVAQLELNVVELLCEDIRAEVPKDQECIA